MAETLNYLSDNHGRDLTEFERHYEECVAKRDAAKAAFDEASRRLMGNNSIGIPDRLKQHNALKTRHAKEMAALNTEIAEMDRVRANTISIVGENFYRKNSQKRKEVTR